MSRHGFTCLKEQRYVIVEKQPYRALCLCLCLFVCLLCLFSSNSSLCHRLKNRKKQWWGSICTIAKLVEVLDPDLIKIIIKFIKLHLTKLQLPLASVSSNTEDSQTPPLTSAEDSQTPPLTSDLLQLININHRLSMYRSRWEMCSDRSFFHASVRSISRSYFLLSEEFFNIIIF